MANNNIVCLKCHTNNSPNQFFCKECGAFLKTETFENTKMINDYEMKIMRIIENLQHTPHYPIVWDETVDLYTRKVEQFQALFKIPEIGAEFVTGLSEKMNDFLDLSRNPEFQIAFVGTIKTGKSTLINALLGHNYASMAVTPETAALTKFRSSSQDYIKVTFYTEFEWEELWNSRTSGADAFIKEYEDLNAEAQRKKWIGHAPIYKEVTNSEIKNELYIWSSSKHAEHYFVKEVEVGISNLPSEFPKQVVFVDTPGLSDPVAYRSEITKQYIRKANAVFVCVDAQKLQKEEIETISSVFSFSSHNKNKVYIIATHWDKLNDPEKDWIDQKSWMIKRLTGKGFFENSKAAEKNIMHSAAYIYNLCRDFSELNNSEMRSLKQFAFLYEINPTPEELFKNLNILKNATNIDNILKRITDEFVLNYRELLNADIEKQYLDIVFNLRRFAEEGKKETLELIELSNADIQELEKKVTQKQKDLAEIRQQKEQLQVVVNSVEKITRKRLEEVRKLLNEVAVKKQ